MNDLEGALHERIIHAWRILDNLAPQEARASSYEDIPPTYLGVPLGSVPGTVFASAKQPAADNGHQQKAKQLKVRDTEQWGMLVSQAGAEGGILLRNMNLLWYWGLHAFETEHKNSQECSRREPRHFHARNPVVTVEPLDFYALFSWNPSTPRCCSRWVLPECLMLLQGCIWSEGSITFVEGNQGSSEPKKEMKEKKKLRRQRKLSLHQLRKRRHIGSKEP
eukprot:1143146-Pelagomonas_calceolata.AAC.1